MSIANKRLEIAEQADCLVNQVDLVSETLLLAYPDSVERIDQKRRVFIDRIRHVEASNLANLTRESLNSVDRAVFKNYCFILNKQVTEMPFLDDIDASFGYLMVANGYMSPDQQLQAKERLGLTEIEKLNFDNQYFELKYEEFKDYDSQIETRHQVKTNDFVINLDKRSNLEYSLKEVVFKNVIIESIKPDAVLAFKTATRVELIYWGSFDPHEIRRSIELLQANSEFSCQSYSLRVLSNQCPTLESEFLQGIVNLDHLDFGSGRLDYIEPTSLSGSTSLHVLKLNDNRLNSLSATIFDQLTNLIKLDLKSNILEALHPNMFHNLVNLKHLNLSGNRITSIDEEMFSQLRNLQHLDLGGNLISNMPSACFINQAKLVYLNLESNKLHDIDSTILQGLCSLESLNLDSNRLFWVDPDTFKDLSSLRELVLVNNYLDFDSLKDLLADKYPKLILT